MVEANEQKCLVCSAPSEGTHFGVEVCRACAAFFRRSVSLKRSYVCKTGTRSCDLSNSIRSMCRHCRFQTCLSVGMLKEHVQPNRDSLKNSVVVPKAKIQSQTVSSSNDTPSRAERRRPASAPQASISWFTPAGASAPQASTSWFTPAVASPSLYLVDATTSTNDILDRIEKGYYRLCEARVTMEIDQLSRINCHIGRGPLGIPDIKMATWQLSLETYKSSMPLCARFLRSTFEDYAQLPRGQKWILFRYFLEHIWTLERFYDTRRYFPQPANRCVMITPCTYVDLNQFGLFGDASFIESPDGKILKLSLERTLEFQNLLKMKKIDFTDTEFAALVALTLFSEALDKLEPETVKTVRRMRERVFYGLHFYYTEKLRIDDYAHRLGEAMSLLTLIWTNEYKERTTAETAALFCLYNIGDTIYEDFNTDLL